MIPHHRPECYSSPCAPECPVRSRIETAELSERMYQQRAAETAPALAAMTARAEKAERERAEAVSEASTERRRIKDRCNELFEEAREWERKFKGAVTDLVAERDNTARCKAETADAWRITEVWRKRYEDKCDRVDELETELARLRAPESEQCKGSGLLLDESRQASPSMAYCSVCGRLGDLTPGMHVKPHPPVIVIKLNIDGKRCP